MKMMATFWISKISKTCGSNRVCDVCLQTVEKIFLCQRCQHAKYCSKECQILDWKEKGHKKACKLMAKEKWQKEKTERRRRKLRRVKMVLVTRMIRKHVCTKQEDFRVSRCKHGVKECQSERCAN